MIRVFNMDNKEPDNQSLEKVAETLSIGVSNLTLVTIILFVVVLLIDPRMKQFWDNITFSGAFLCLVAIVASVQILPTSLYQITKAAILVLFGTHE